MQNWAFDPRKKRWLFEKPISKPLLDDRAYRLIMLENNLQVLLISDRSADQVGMALDVGVGHVSDPKDMPGLAHFCEHLLFMGTTPFPEENAYKQFVKRHGGFTNASTAASTTTYQFSIQAPYLSGAMERFAAFFHSPLFSSSCVGREVLAVDSENSKNQQMDSRRLYQLWKSQSDEGHPWNTFGCGNKDTLLPSSKEETQNGMSTGNSDEEALKLTRMRVMQWWEANYCAGRMKVAVVGAESLDDLEELAIKNLHPIPNRQLGPPPVIKAPPWSNDHDSYNLVFVKTIKDMNRLEIRFLLPDQDPQYMVAPTRYVSNLIGHEGPGSALNLMMTRGLATALSCGFNSAGRGMSMLDVDISLTKEGLVKYRRVLAILFRSIERLPAALQSPYHFEERRLMGDIGFKYREKSGSLGTYTKMLARRMNAPYAREHILSCGVDEWQFDSAAIETVIACLTLSRARVFVAAREFEGIDNAVGEWEAEKWYGTEYLRSRLDDELPALTVEEDKSLYLPEINPFLPKGLEVNRTDTQTVRIADRRSDR